MDEFRQLSDAERKIVLKQLENLKEQREYKTYLSHYCDLMLNEGLWQNFLAQKKKMQADKRSINEEIFLTDKTILTLKEQLEKGVLKKGGEANGGQHDTQTSD